MTMGLQGYGQPGDWQDDIYYPIGQSVAWNGAMWRAVTQNRNSEPAVDNADWTFVLGSGLMATLTLTPAQIQSLGSFPVDIVVPANATTFIAPVEIVVAEALGSATYSAPPGLVLQYSDTSLTFPVDSGSWDGSAAEVDYTPDLFSTMEGSLQLNDVTAMLGVSLQITSGGDVTGGDAPCTVILTYRSYDLTNYLVSNFFAITSVNQLTKTINVGGDASSGVVVGGSMTIVGSTGNNGSYVPTIVTFTASASNAITAVSTVAKRFTIAGDHVAEYPVGMLITVAGSTGNDGNYTVASATLSTDTLIVVLETVPDATADGTIDNTDETVITVSAALPDATADGWVEVS